MISDIQEKLREREFKTYLWSQGERIHWPKVLVKCQWCGIVYFEPKFPNQKYCSELCAGEMKKKYHHLYWRFNGKVPRHISKQFDRNWVWNSGEIEVGLN